MEINWVDEYAVTHTQNINVLHIKHEKHEFYLSWDDRRNALLVLDISNNGKLCVFPSSNNGILIQSVKS